ncbi:MAG: hypothetical protein IE886_03355 [Campylobacterales bacterium]|nr:hypothetical protein [Campylobacterales bacterium]
MGYSDEESKSAPSERQERHGKAEAAHRYRWRISTISSVFFSDPGHFAIDTDGQQTVTVTRSDNHGFLFKHGTVDPLPSLELFLLARGQRLAAAGFFL